jgi:hypothetical protein
MMLVIENLKKVFINWQDNPREITRELTRETIDLEGFIYLNY